MQYEIRPLTEEDEAFIEKKIGEYAYMMAPPEPGTPEEERIIFRAAERAAATLRRRSSTHCSTNWTQ